MKQLTETSKIDLILLRVIINRNKTGSAAGSWIINKRFQELVKNMVGEEKYLELKNSEGYVDAMQQFDREVKPGFVGDPDQAWNIHFTMANLEDDPANNIMQNCLRLSRYV